jgi:predicted nucleic acid-binding Zn ribbon protein
MHNARQQKHGDAGITNIRRIDGIGCIVCGLDISATHSHAAVFCSDTCERIYRRAGKYGVTAQEVLALFVGDRACNICGKADSDHIDHDHATGQVRGLLCRSCNLGLGMFADDPDRVAAAISYLARAVVASGPPAQESAEDTSP